MTAACSTTTNGTNSMAHIIGIAYCSQLVDFSFETIDEILSVSQRNNLDAGLTGALIYDNKTFLQWLEGSPSEIRAVFERIVGDLRHTNIKLLSVRTLESRLFPDWTMTAAVTQGQTLRGFKLVPHLSLAEFNPAQWSEEDSICFINALSDYLTHLPASKSEPIMNPVVPDRNPVDPLRRLNESLDYIRQSPCKSLASKSA